jgi:predicted PurR-regulated permease PerM
MATLLAVPGEAAYGSRCDLDSGISAERPHLLWQLRHIVVWFVIALFLAAALNPYVTWLQQRRVKRILAILLTYVGLLLGAVGLVALVLPALITEVRALISFITTLAQQPGG